MSDAYWDNYNNALGAADTVRKNMLARQAGGMIANGDMSGARNVFYREGDLTNGSVMDTRIAADRKTKAEAASRWAQGLGRMMSDPRYASNPDAAYEAARPFAERLGLDPREVEADKQLFVRDPKGYATMLLEKAGEELQIVEGPNGIYAVGKTSGNSRKVQDYPQAPIAMDPDKNYYLPDDGSAQTGTPTRDTQGNAVPPPPPPPAADYRERIANIESRGSGDYAAVGKPNPKGQRAYGRYQVMDFNIPQWTQEVLGRRMTPQEFLANPQAQDAVFDAKFGSYIERYGSPEEAASVWFTGKPMAQGANRRDVNGMTGARYVQKFAQNAGGQPLQGGSAQDTVADIPGYRLVQRAQAKAGETWAPDGKGFLVNKNGDVKPDPRFATADGAKITDGDKKTTGFAYRTMQASKRMAALADRGIFKPRTPTAQLFDTDKNGLVRVVTKTAEDRQFIQAAKEWLAPVLRKDTGAAVTDQELATYMDIFIPRFEDGQAEMQQKAEARLDTMKALVNEAGPLYERTYGKPQYTSKYPQKPAAKAKPSARTQGKGWKVLSVE